MADKDLFDDSTMTFGEHLEALRIHLWKAIIGLVIGCTAAFFFSNHIIVAIQKPVIEVMQKKFGHHGIDDLKAEKGERSPLELLTDWWNETPPPPDAPDDTAAKKEATLQLQLDARDVAQALHAAAPDKYPAFPEDAPSALVAISLVDTPLGKLIAGMLDENLKPRTDGVDEAFMIYLKVSLVVGLILASPWIFYQIWLFVAAGLYPHERQYVYSYLPISLGLFLGGAFFCFFFVIPQVLSFLFEFNIWLKMRPEIKISTWISFSLVVSLMFGISFQLPLVMVLLEKISIVDVKLYREKRRYAILIISIVSMILTPSDPVSMMMMLIPLCLLYELGILLCAKGTARRSPFEPQPT